MTFRKGQGGKRGFRKGNVAGRGTVYKCVYCKKPFNQASKMAAHEHECPMRYAVRVKWATDIERSKRKIEKAGRENRNGGKKGE